MRAQPRLRHVVDPVWRVLNPTSFTSAWSTLSTEAHACGFVGLDLEWTTVDVDSESAPSGQLEGTKVAKAPTKKAKRLTGPVATVQLSTNTVSLVIKYCDLWHLVKGSEDGESGWEGDPYASISSSWPNHRVGERNNSREQLTHVLDVLHDLLQADAVVKVGVGIAGDMAKFQRDYPGQSIQPCVDLVTLANRHIHHPIAVRLPSGFDLPSQNAGSRVAAEELLVDVSEVHSLKEMCAVFCGRILEKDGSVVTSDWGGSLGALSPLQIRYAASDAEASFDACVGILEAAFPTPPSAAPGNEATGNGEATLGQVSSERSSWLEVLTPLFITSISVGNSDKVAIGAGGSPAVAAGGKKMAKRTLTQRLKSYQHGDSSEDEVVDVGWCKGRAKQYYDNINVFDPNMNLVFTVDQSKAEWYVYKKGIAKVIEWRDADLRATPESQTQAGDETLTNREPRQKQIAAIMLSFTPDFRKFNDAHIRRNLEYFQQPKENVCVVCGATGSLVRFAVIPMMYRRYFPSVYMSHNSYDLLLLCTTCFAKSRGVYDAERQRVAADFGIPLSHLTPARLAVFEEQVAAAANAAAESDQAADVTTNHDDNGETDDLVAHHLSPQLRVKVMREFAEVERHYDCLVTILKYAKALHGHYISTGADTGPSLTGNNRFVIPDEKLALMRAAVDTHAPRYYFYSSDNASAAAAAALASEPSFPSSPEGVRWILVGDAQATSQGGGDDDDDSREDRSPGAARLRRTLADYWLRVNPHLTAYIPRTVRDEGKSEAPLVDSHGFFVVRMLMEKYAGCSAKNGEHAVGQFIYRWRRTFLDKMQPQHLPNGWLAEDGILR